MTDPGLGIDQRFPDEFFKTLRIISEQFFLILFSLLLNKMVIFLPMQVQLIINLQFKNLQKSCQFLPVYNGLPVYSYPKTN